MRLIIALLINLILLGIVFLYQSVPVLAGLLGISVLGWFIYYLAVRQKTAERRVSDKVANHEVIIPVEHIMFWALESSGYSQASGMGYIVLTKDMLYFEMVLIDLVVEIPTSKIKGADFIRRLKGVSPIVQMLQIRFENQNGENDSIAIGGKNKSLWHDTINNLVNHT